MTGHGLVATVLLELTQMAAVIHGCWADELLPRRYGGIVICEGQCAAAWAGDDGTAAAAAEVVALV